jgi:uncharacterized membrane protein
MRSFVFALLAAYWAFCLALYPRLPARIAIHFNMRGEADGWSDNPFLAWFALPVIITLTVALIAGIERWGTASPHLWNVPEKKRFLAMTPEQRKPVIAILSGILDMASVYSIAVGAVVQWTIYSNALKSHGGGLNILFHIVVWGGMLFLLGYALMVNKRIKQMILAGP